jgi:phosphatidylinositol alpha-1,6-mannosyltransferase
MAARAVLMVTRNLPPLVGGMESLLMRALTAIAQRVPVELIGPQGIAERAPPGCKVLAELPFGAGRFLPAAAALTYRFADPRRHQLCLGGSGLMAPALQAARWRGLRTGVYLHGLDLLYPSALYQRLFVSRLPAIDRILVNSAYTRREALAKGLPEQAIRVVNPAVEMPAADPGVELAAQRLRQELGGGPILLSVGRLVARKGVAEFIEQALPELARRLPGLRLLVVGGEPPGGGGLQLRRLQQAIAAAQMPSVVSLLGAVSNERLAVLYASADLHVLPLVDIPGDVEGFGMVVLEAAARGVPTVAFELGGVADALDSEAGGGRLVRSGEYSELVTAACQVLAAASSDSRAQLIEKARHRSWSRFGEELVAALELEY